MYKYALNGCVLRPLQEFFGVTSKLDAPPLSLSGFSPATQIWGNSLQDYPSFAGETVGTRIDRDNSLIMSLRLRGGYATTRRRRLYYAHKGSRTAKTSELVLAYQR